MHTFNRFRTTTIKRGQIVMLAVVATVVNALHRFFRKVLPLPTTTLLDPEPTLRCRCSSPEL
jgi:hypothetical protein